MTANQVGVRKQSEGDFFLLFFKKHAPTTVRLVQSINVTQKASRELWEIEFGMHTGSGCEWEGEQKGQNQGFLHHC